MSASISASISSPAQSQSHSEAITVKNFYGNNNNNNNDDYRRRRKSMPVVVNFANNGKVSAQMKDKVVKQQQQQQNEQLSEYELIRQKNIAERKAMLEKLGFGANKKTPKQQPQKVTKVTGPVRASQRLKEMKKMRLKRELEDKLVSLGDSPMGIRTRTRPRRAGGTGSGCRRTATAPGPRAVTRTRTRTTRTLTRWSAWRGGPRWRG